MVKSSSEMTVENIKQAVRVLICLMCILAALFGIEYARYQIYDAPGSDFWQFVWLDLIWH